MGVDSRLVLTYGLTNFLFIACGAVTVAVSVVWNNEALNSPSIITLKIVLILAAGPVEQNIIFMMTPTMIGLGAGVLTVVAGLTSLPRTLSYHLIPLTI
jgi:hypothetical protein